MRVFNTADLVILREPQRSKDLAYRKARFFADFGELSRVALRMTQFDEDGHVLASREHGIHAMARQSNGDCTGS